MSEMVETDLGLLPKTWPLKPVGEVFETQLGKMLSTKAKTGKNSKFYLRNKNVQWGQIDVSDLLEMDFDERERKKFALVPGDLLVCEGGVVGRAALWQGEVEDCYFQKALHRLRPANGSVTNEFMLYWLRFAFEIQNFYGVSGASSTIAHLPAAQLRALELPVPPLPEQKKIALFLSTVQRAIEAQERIIQTTTELKKALMHKLFTEGLRHEAGRPHAQKQTEIGPIPESWEVVRLSDVCQFQSGGTPSKQNPEFWKGTIPWVSPKDMKRPRLTDVEDHISQEALESGSKLAPAGSVFVVVRGMILAKTVPVALAEVPMAINQDMKAIVPGQRLRSDFLLYAMEAFRENLFKKVGRSGHGTCTLLGHEVAAFNIPLPDLKTQEELASAIQNLERKKALHEEKRAQLQDLFRTLLHELMTAKTRVHTLEISL